MPGASFAAVENAMVYEMAKNGADGNHRPSMGCVPSGGLESGGGRRRSRAGPSLHGLASLRPLGQLRESFILAVNQEGLWIIDQHVAHERILFERVLRQRRVAQVERQRLLMPMLIDLLPAQMVTFAGIAQELEGNGFEAEPFGPRTIAIKAAPAGLEGSEFERMLVEVLEQAGSPEQAENLEAARSRIAASIACHAAIKSEHPARSCTHGVAAERTRENRTSDQLPAWPSHRPAVCLERNPAGISPDLKAHGQLFLASPCEMC